MSVPYFKPSIIEDEINEVVKTMKSGWLTTGPKTKQFEESFAKKLGVEHAVAVSSATAALHLSLEAIGLERNDLVIVPTMTFAATAEVVRYFDAIPIFVDCDEETLCIDPVQARRTLENLRDGKAASGLPSGVRGKVKAMLPVHYAGQMVDVDALTSLAQEFDFTIIEDAAHTMPAAYRSNQDAPWRSVGSTALLSCFSFYANKPITTGEGGMVVTDSAELEQRIRMMSLHGISRDLWSRHSKNKLTAYQILGPGFKYNLTDIASSIGIHQLKRADELHANRKRIADRYRSMLKADEYIVLPVELEDRIHSWHMFVIRLKLDRLSIGRDRFMEEMKKLGITTSVHYLPLHRHEYYREKYGYLAEDFPVANRLYDEILSLPIYPDMKEEDIDEVVDAIRSLCLKFGK